MVKLTLGMEELILMITTNLNIEREKMGKNDL